jgi:hypothetical protein
MRRDATLSREGVVVSDPPSDDLNIERGEIVFDLPASLTREIGRIIVAYANLEHRLSVIIYALLGVPSAIGRLAVREPRSTDRFDLIVQLLDLREVSVDETEISDLKAAISEVAAQRDRIAHGIWIRSRNGTLHLRLTRGAWQPVEGQRGKTSRAILPEGPPYTTADALSLRKLLHAVLIRVEAFAQQVAAALEALPEIHDPQSRTVDRIRDRIRGGRSRQP